MSVAALTTLAAVSAKADVLTVNGGWDTFYFGAAAHDPSSVFQDINGNPLDFSFTLAQTTKLTVADGYFDGDQFQIFNNGLSLGLTSTPSLDGQYIGADWNAALTNPAFSSGVWVLGPGTYDITGVAVQSPYFNGEGAIALGAVPEPATWAMLILGLGMIGVAARRRASGQMAGVAA